MVISLGKSMKSTLVCHVKLTLKARQFLNDFLQFFAFFIVSDLSVCTQVKKKNRRDLLSFEITEINKLIHFTIFTFIISGTCTK